MNDDEIIENLIDFPQWILERKKFLKEENIDEVLQELTAFVEEFNNWLTANFQEFYIKNNLIKDVKSLDLDNTMFEQYCDAIRIHSSMAIKPSRFDIISSLYAAQYKLAAKRGDTRRFDLPF